MGVGEEKHWDLNLPSKEFRWFLLDKCGNNNGNGDTARTMTPLVVS
jgi:hypothetical protein